MAYQVVGQFGDGELSYEQAMTAIFIEVSGLHSRGWAGCVAAGGSRSCCLARQPAA